jgi:hypothetical protein
MNELQTLLRGIATGTPLLRKALIVSAAVSIPNSRSAGERRPLTSAASHRRHTSTHPALAQINSVAPGHLSFAASKPGQIDLSNFMQCL